jgi:DNA-directed RNA polymerase specialized sigma24 family protein
MVSLASEFIMVADRLNPPGLAFSVQRLSPNLQCRRDHSQSIACRSLLHCLVQADLTELARFASFRLARMKLTPSEGEDFAQDALLAVLKGLDTPTAGRHPRPLDVADPAKCLAYLKGVISSLVEAERRRLQCAFVHEQFEENFSHTDRLRSDPGDQCDFEYEEFRQEFFKRLLQKAPVRLRDLVLAWREQSDSHEQIPTLGLHRRYRCQLRILAAHVLNELAQEPCIGPNARL